MLLAVGVGRAEPKSKPKPKPKPQLKQKKPVIAKAAKPEKKIKKAPAHKKVKVSIKPAEEKAAPAPAAPKIFARKNALDLKKDAEKTEKDLFEDEKRWETPAFLRRQEAK